jgi:hypothetical protein
MKSDLEICLASLQTGCHAVLQALQERQSHLAQPAEKQEHGGPG